MLKRACPASGLHAYLLALECLMSSRADLLVTAVERLKQTPVPNYPIENYQPADWKTLHAFVEMLQDSSAGVAELVAEQVLEAVPDLRLSDDDTTTDQLKYHYAVSRLREAARDVMASKSGAALATLFVRNDDFAEELSEIRRGIAFIQASVDDVKRELKPNPLEGFSVNIGPIGVPLTAVSKAAALATGVLANVAGVDAIALSIQLQGMTANARLALRQGVAQGVSSAVTNMLRAVTERAAATADIGLGILRRAVQLASSEREPARPIFNQASLARALGFTAHEIAVDLGSSRLRVHAKGRGVVVDAETVPYVKGANVTRLERLSGLGASASPVIGGAVADAEVAQNIIKRAVRGVGLANGFARPRTLVGVPAGATAVERRAMRRVVQAMPASKVQLIDAPIAAAAGAGLNISSLEGCMVGDIGAGKTEVSVIALNGLVYSRSVRLGGDDLTWKIREYLMRSKGVRLSLDECERLKLNFASVNVAPTLAASHDLVGFDRKNKTRSSTTIDFEDINIAIAEPMNEIIEAFKVALEATPPEIADAVQRNGIMLTGGGSLLSGLDAEIRDHTGMPVSVAIDPALAIIRGLALLLEDPAYVRILELTH